MSTPTPRNRVPGAGSEPVAAMSFSEMNAAVREAKDKILVLTAERDALADTLAGALLLLELIEKSKNPNWDRSATPESIIGKARSLLAASSHDIRQAGES